MGAATIRIFLADGTPLGIRIVEKSNWTGRGMDFARADWVRARTLEDFGTPGVNALFRRHSNGRLDWKDDKGTSLETLQEPAAA